MSFFNRDKIKEKIRYWIQVISGTSQYEERINTLYFFLNNYCDILSFPEATGSLRMIQKGDALLLQIVDIICVKHKIEYWIDAGTCLGAVRHHGFIPWDDDIDINMIRTDYERARHILKEELKEYGISVEESKDEPIAHVGIGYKHRETGLWIDLFPFEYTTIDPKNKRNIEGFKRKNTQYQRQWRKKRNKYDRKKMFKYRKKFIPEICEKKEAKSIINCPEWCPKPMIFEVKNIFPLNYMMFEGFKVPVPNDAHKYLEIFYGNNYMNFPQSGVMHHGDGRGHLSTWAQKSGTDMNQIIRELEDVLNMVKQ